MLSWALFASMSLLKCEAFSRKRNSIILFWERYKDIKDSWQNHDSLWASSPFQASCKRTYQHLLSHDSRVTSHDFPKGRACLQATPLYFPKAVIKISSCWVYVISRQGIEQLESFLRSTVLYQSSQRSCS